MFGQLQFNNVHVCKPTLILIMPMFGKKILEKLVQSSEV